MTRPNSNPPRAAYRSSRLPRIAALLLVTGLSVGMVSCDRADPTQQAMDAANLKLETLSVAGANPVYSVKSRRDAFNDIVAKLKTIADSTDATHGPSAAMLVSRAKSGLGEISAKDAADLEEQFLSQVTVSRALLDQWRSQHSVAAALSQFNPKKDLDALDKEMAAKTAEAAALNAEKAKQEAVVANILAQAGMTTTAAKAARDRVAGIRKLGEGQSQTDRETTIVNAVKASREADALDKQAAEFTAQAATESPKVDELANQAERLRRQVDSLGKAKLDITKRADDARKQAAEATAEANAVGDKIKKSLADLAATRDAAAAPTQEAVKQYSSAAQGAKKAATTAQKESKTASSAALGGFQQSLGDVLSTKARSLAAYAATLDSMAKATPAIPGAAEVATKAAAANTELEAAKKEAETAYDEAKNAYDRAGGGGDLKAKIEALSKSLAELKELKNKPVEAPKPPEAPAPPPAPAPAADAKPAAAAPAAAPGALSAEDSKKVEDEVRAMLKDIAAASAAGDFDKVSARMSVKNESDKKFLEATLPLGKAAKSLDAACTAKFGKDLGTLVKESQSPTVKGNPILGMMLPMLTGGKGSGMVDAASAESAAIKAVSLTEADVSGAGSPGTVKARKEGDTWKLAAGDALAAAGPMAQQMLPMFKSMTTAFAKTAASTTEGKYAAPDDMLTDLSTQLMAAMGSMMGGPGGAPGLVKPKPGGNKPPAPPSGGGGG